MDRGETTVLKISTGARLRRAVACFVALIAGLGWVVGVPAAPAQAATGKTVAGYGAETSEPLNLAAGLYLAEVSFTDNSDDDGNPTTFEANLTDESGTVAGLASEVAKHDTRHRIVQVNAGQDLTVAVRVAGFEANWTVSFTPLSQPTAALSTASGTGDEAPDLYLLKAAGYAATVTYSGNDSKEDVRVELRGATGGSSVLADSSAASGTAKTTLTVGATGTFWLDVTAAAGVSWTVTLTPLATLTTAPTPTISGTVKVGKTLTAKPGTWKPSGVSFSYQWKRSGTAISGATKATYKLTKSDKGKKITVTVTGTKTGYASVSKTSKSTSSVK